MKEMLGDWLTPLGLLSIVAAGNLVLSIRSAMIIKKLEVNTNSMQKTMDSANIAKGQIIERDNARERQEAGKNT